jgi:hypothetical protein
MCKLEYMDLEGKYLDVLKYCLKFSDSFSVITTMKKAYSQKTYIPEHDKVLKEWDFCLVEQNVGIKEWPGTRTNAKRKVMNVYNARKFRTTIIDIPNFFRPEENNLPEDICFYRDKEPWFITVSHEKMIFLDTPTLRDLQYFSEREIRVYKD